VTENDAILSIERMELVFVSGSNWLSSRRISTKYVTFLYSWFPIPMMTDAGWKRTSSAG